MYQYKRKIAYHETDKMGVTHHSNYVKFLEEARVGFLDEIGCSYSKLEQENVVSPVVEVLCKYKNPTTFDDSVSVNIKIKEYSGVRIAFEYEIINEKTNKLILNAKTVHCFTDENGKIVNLKKVFPHINEKLSKHIKTDVL
jgi:acyl-CoA thioester hydrolase